MNEEMSSLLVSRFFFSLFSIKKGEKKRKKKKEELHEKIFALKKKQKISSSQRGVFCVHMKELMMMNSNFLHSFKEAVT